MDFNKTTFALIERIASLYQAELRHSAKLYNLHERQLAALNYISICNRYSDSPQALTRYLNLTKGTVSQTLLALERKKLIAKTSDSDDSRRIHLKLTTQGKQIVNSCSTDFRKSSLTNNLIKKTELGQLNLLLGSLLRSLQQKNNHLTFGQCYTCQHFQKNGLAGQHRCGLTGEALSTKDSKKICQEHRAG